MDARQKRLLLMKEAPVPKALVMLAIPSVIAMLVNALYNFVDTMFVGMLNNTQAMAGVSVGLPLTIMILGMGQLAGLGASSYVGRKLGAGDMKAAQRGASIAIWMGLGFAGLTCVFGLVFIEPLLTIMGATPDIMDYAKEYGTVIIIGSLFTIINMVFNNLLRTEGAARISMTTLILGAVVNIILDPLFMFDWGLGLGVSGAAIATVIAQICSTLYILSYYIRGKSVIRINKESLFGRTREDRKIFVEILKIGSPAFAMQLLSSIAMGLLNTAAATFGEAPLATLGISNKIYMMVMQVFQGYVQAFLPFTAYNLGAKAYKRVRQGAFLSLGILMSVGMMATFIFNTIPHVFIKLFTNDPEVVQLGINALTAQTYMLTGIAAILIINSLFQATGRAKEAAILSIGRQGIFFIPMIMILPKICDTYGIGILKHMVPHTMPNGLYGVMFAQPVADTITLVLALVLGVKTLKALKRLEQDSEIAVDTLVQLND